MIFKDFCAANYLQFNLHPTKLLILALKFFLSQLSGDTRHP